MRMIILILPPQHDFHHESCFRKRSALSSRAMMRTKLLLLVFFAACVSAYAAEPCKTATSDCTQMVKLGEQAQGLIYRTYSLDVKNDKITRALIVVHGQGRDADNYFRTALAATFLASAFDDTIVI